ncbi:hypothetical protein ACFWWC_40315, partial [Streptomyces sp. NPDC058642]
QRGVMHRDVKPANILLAPDRSGSPYGRVLLTDYGNAVQPDAGEARYTLASVLVGTAGYLAPERATGGPPTAAADLFSLGGTLYYAVEGHGPFERDSQLAEITAVVTDPPRPPRRAGALGPVLEAMLVKDPAQRISASEVEAALWQIVTPQAGSPPQTHTAHDTQPSWTSAGTSTAPKPLPLPTHTSPTEAQEDPAAINGRLEKLTAHAMAFVRRFLSAAHRRDLIEDHSAGREELHPTEAALHEAADDSPWLDDLFASHAARIAEILDDTADGLEHVDLSVSHHAPTPDPDEVQRLTREAREAVDSDLVALFLRLGAPPEAIGTENAEPVNSGGGGTRE